MVLVFVFIIVIFLTFALFLALTKVRETPPDLTNQSPDSNSAQESLKQSVQNPDPDSDYLLRGNPAPVALPAISPKQRAFLAKCVNDWNPEFDNLRGAIVSVVGATYRSQAARETYATLKVGDRIFLKIDPNNRYDETAVKVFAKRCHIGYVPQDFSSQIYWHCILDKIECCYVIQRCSDKALRGVRFVMFLKKE